MQGIFEMQMKIVNHVPNGVRLEAHHTRVLIRIVGDTGGTQVPPTGHQLSLYIINLGNVEGTNYAWNIIKDKT